METQFKQFYQKSMAEIEQDLEQAILDHKAMLKKRAIIIFFVLIFLFRGPIFFHIKYAFPHVSKYSKNYINNYQEPIQKDIITPTTKKMKANDGQIDMFGNPLDTSKEDIDYLDKTNPKDVFTFKSLDKKTQVRLLPMAEYSISARVVAYNHMFEIFKSKFDKIALFDIGLAFGSISDEETLKEFFEFESGKRLYSGARALKTEFKKPVDFDVNYVQSHKSHIHVIPANSNVFSALLKLKKYDTVKLDGYLVDMFTKHIHYKSSLSRKDRGKGGRGQGACELMYVNRVQIGNRVYE